MSDLESELHPFPVPPLGDVPWQKCYRLVPACYPPKGIFDEVCDPEELDILYEIESLTNDRLRQEVGQLDLVDPRDRVVGPGTTPIMAAFTHIHPDGSRFTDGSYGAYYAAESIETAIAETKYHRERFLRATNEPPLEITQRCYISRVIKPLRDIRKMEDYQGVYDRFSYSVSQTFGRTIRMAGEWGIWFRSVRRTEGECVAVFRPLALEPAIQGAHYAYVWDGEQITWAYEKSQARNLTMELSDEHLDAEVESVAD